ncbi:CMGC/SRPK protein kinase [Helicocarpus griseus UAMH5409]|uniref:CMGC/SRPK protein kinase n=1 Tax=Helicocarpus griseus UAMH5409 TaxID=1447875 RepID=A0A2B7Y3X3_9EURO|nr:CMGC/SRPK protein kinase [Helicocarpus griseus UAMH5409]
MKPITNICTYAYTPTRSFVSLLCRKPSPIPNSSRESLIPQDETVDEEACPGYNPKVFYPAKPGEVLANRYQTLVKVGWGGESTTWFARNLQGYCWQPESVVALKIINSYGNPNTETSTIEDNEERQVEQYIDSADTSHPGRAILRTYSDCFEITGLEGRKHTCLAYEPMRESFRLFRRRFVDENIPLVLVKIYVQILLEGLDYLHRVCDVVHTDLKLENIMFTFEDNDVLDNFLSSRIDKPSEPMKYKIDINTGHPIYRCHNDFGPLQSKKLKHNIPKIVDFGHANRFMSKDVFGIYPIQAIYYRAPEVILGCGWRTPADIWSLGTLLWDILEGRKLFRHIHDTQGSYDAKAHLAEMIGLLGPPPPELVKRYHSWRGFKWPETIKQGEKLYDTAEEWFGGPFFDDDGDFLYPDMIPDRKLADSLPPCLLVEEEKERVNFLSFVKAMLAWLPKERKTPRELIEHPFLCEK